MQKKYRLKKGFQFNYIYKKGKCIAGKEMAIYYAPNRNKNLQVGISVSKKIGKAHIRNRIKRVFKEAMRAIIKNVSPNFNYVIVARSEAVNSDFFSSQNTLITLLKKANLFITPSENNNITDN